MTSSFARPGIFQMRIAKSLVALLCCLACGGITSCATIPPPPENLAVNYRAESGRLGYVVSLSFFTKAEMKDPAWEFARIQQATMRWCQSEARYMRRDVRWIPIKGAGAKQCAMVVYTVECLDPRDVPDKPNPPFANHLEQSRSEMLNGAPPFSPKPGCGQKDRSIVPIDGNASGRRPGS